MNELLAQLGEAVDDWYLIGAEGREDQGWMGDHIEVGQRLADRADMFLKAVMEFPPDTLRLRTDAHTIREDS